MAESTKLADYIIDVCKIGQGAACCKYLGVGSKGFECMKVSDLKALIDDKWVKERHVAQGDNCPGKEELWLEK